MARKKSGSRLFALIPLLLVAVLGGGIGAYFNPDWPVIGPLVRNLSQRQAAGNSGEGIGGGKLLQAWQHLGSGSESITGTEAVSGSETVPISLNAPSQGNAASSGLASSRRPSDKLLIATFNIQVFGESKLKKPQAMDVLTQVVRQFDVVAIQEVRAKSDDILPKFLAAINADGSRYDFLIGPRLGRTVSTEQYAFIYDTTRVEYEPASVGTVSDPSDLLHREPFVARFLARVAPPARGFSFWLVDIHTDPDEVKEEVEALAQVYQMMRTADSREDDVILLGDLNASESQLGSLGRIPGITWVVRDTMTNTRQNKAYDNLIFDAQATSEFTGRWGVFDLESTFGLSREEALTVSDHLPVWAEFQVEEATSRVNVAERIPGLRR